MTDHLASDFAKDALETMDPTDQDELLELVHRLPDALPAGSPPTRLRARLLEEASRAPERYAPFSRTLSELYDLPRDEVRALLTRSAEPSAWERSGLRGIEKLPVLAGPSCRNAQTYLMKFKAGVRFPEHHHDGLETVPVMAGAYTKIA